jgi:hypothetical protein
MEENQRKEIVEEVLPGLVHVLLYDTDEVAAILQPDQNYEMVEHEVLSTEINEFGLIDFRVRILLAGSAGHKVEVVSKGEAIYLNGSEDDAGAVGWDLSAEYDVESCEVVSS